MNLFKKEESEIVKAMQERIEKLKDTAYDVDEDRKAIENLKDLAEIKDKLEGPQMKVNPNTVISVVGSLVGVGLIIVNEKFLVLNTKAWPFIPKIFNK